MWNTVLAVAGGMLGRVAGVAIIIAAIASAIYVWHYKPMNAYEAQVKQLEQNINDLATAYSECEMQKSKSSIDSYIEGIGDDTVVPAVSLDDLHT